MKRARHRGANDRKSARIYQHARDREADIPVLLRLQNFNGNLVGSGYLVHFVLSNRDPLAARSHVNFIL